MPTRRHSFANMEKTAQTAPASGGESTGKKRGGRFKRWRKVSFSVGDTVHHVPYDKSPISRSLSTGDSPVGRSLKKIKESTTNQIQNVSESDTVEQILPGAMGNMEDLGDNSQVNMQCYLLCLL